MSDPYITTETASKINDALNAVWKQYEKDILPGIQQRHIIDISEYKIELAPFRLRIKWKLQYWRLRAGIRIGGWIANHPLEESYDYDA